MLKQFFKKSPLLTPSPFHTFKTIQKLLPAKYEPYYRLGRYDKQIGTLLLYIPCTWGIAMAQPYLMPLQFLKYAGLTYMGAIVSRSAGCIINDLWDQDFDKKVERTKTRPLASGELNANQAWLFFIPHVAVGLGILSQFNLASIKWTLSIIPVAALYPAAKRVTTHPQLVLGLAFNWGVWVGYCAIQGAVDYATCGFLYSAGICWTLIYDTIYAHQDKEDDKMIGVKSTALAWGDRTKEFSNYLNLVMFGCLSAAGYMAEIGWLYYPALTGTAFFMKNMLNKVDINNRESCDHFFRKNRIFGFLVLLSILIGKMPIDMNQKGEKKSS